MVESFVFFLLLSVANRCDSWFSYFGVPVEFHGIVNVFITTFIYGLIHMCILVKPGVH